MAKISNNTAPRPRRWPAVRGRFFALFAAVAALWVLEIIDVVFFRHALNGLGIVPRTVNHATGILFAPLLHRDFAHLLANTGPLLIAGSLIALHGARALFGVTVIVWLMGGLLEWLFAPAGICAIGASGVVFGYIGFLLAYAVVCGRPLSIIAALVCAWFYGSLILPNVLPTAQSAANNISWHGHFFGFISGIFAARTTRRGRR